jgi:hypothetical protein
MVGCAYLTEVAWHCRLKNLQVSLALWAKFSYHQIHLMRGEILPKAKDGLVTVLELDMKLPELGLLAPGANFSNPQAAAKYQPSNAWWRYSYSGNFKGCLVIRSAEVR